MKGESQGPMRIVILWTCLLLAISLEVIGTSFLAASKRFTVVWASVALIFAYTGAYFLFGHVLAFMPLGIAYATWCGLGITATSLIGLLFLKQSLNLGSIVGLGLILIGSIVINLWGSGPVDE